MCGEESKLFKTDVEGVILNVCKNCGKFGKVISAVADKIKVRKKQKSQPVVETELVQVIADDVARRVSRARQKLGMKQEHLAKKIAEKESLVQKIESGQFTPSIRLARKLENHLRIKLVEQHAEKREQKFKSDKVALTIGDMLQLK